MTARVTVHADGTSTYESLGTVSSANTQKPGLKVSDGMGSRIVTAADQLKGHELVRINGMEMKADQAKELGLLDQAIADTMPKDGADDTDAATAATDPEAPKGRNTGHEGYDAVTAALAENVEAGVISHEESHVYRTAVATLAMAEIDTTEIMDVVDGLAEGSLRELDVELNTRQIAHSLEQRVTQAASKAVLNEIGQQGFDRLSHLAAASPVVNSALRNYAVMRATGQTTDTWAQFLQAAEDELAG